ncbi:MAG: hypothetical protein ACJ76Z_13925, partial [Thermoleophilaceae bacterium]
MPSIAFLKRPRFLIAFSITALALAAALIAVGATGGSHVAKATCPPGYVRAERELAARTFGERNASKACMRVDHPELPEDIAKFSENAGLRFGGERPGQLRAALRQRARLSDDKSVSGANGTWQPLGKGPLVANDPNYPYTYGDAFGLLAGRISDYAYDPSTNRLWATFAQG